jgi:hypothetical protein
MKCWKCDSDKDFDSKKSLRTHQIAKGNYDKESFEKKFENNKVDEGEQEEEEDEPADSTEELEEEETDSVELENVDEDMEELDMDDVIEESEDEEDDSESSEKPKGIESMVNDGYGSLAVIGMPEKEEGQKDDLREDLQQLAKDVGLGRNAKWYYEEELKGNSDDPQKALIGSALIVLAATVAQRPDLRTKIDEKVREKKEEME